jgi:hypothetical protein
MISKKLPAIMFYPSDWHNDVKVQNLTLHDRAIWFELLLIMHVAEERGKLILNGEPMDTNWLAKKVGIKPAMMTKALLKFCQTGVAYVDDKGIIYNKRMVQDERLRQVRAEAGKQGGNPILLNQKTEGRLNTKPTPSYSSSIPSSNTITEGVQDLQQKTTHNNDWIHQTVLSTGIPTHILKSFCENWITTAELKCKFDEYPVNKLIAFMVEDLLKNREKLMPLQVKDKTSADFW